MLNKIIRKIEGIEEYGNEIKIIYKKEELEVYNYQKLISISDDTVRLLNLLVEGEELTVIYQDPIKIKIKGKITNVTKQNQSTIQN